MIRAGAAFVLVLAAAEVGVGPAGASAGAAAHTTPAGMAAARAALLRRADLGRRWSVQAPPPAKVPRLTCPAFDPVTKGAAQVGDAASPTFEATAGGPFVSEVAYAYATNGQEATVWRAVVRPGLLRCAKASLRAGGGGGVQFQVTGGRVLRLPAPAAGYRVSGTASLPYQTIDVYLDLLVVGHGTMIATVVVSSFEQPPSSRLESRVLRTVAHRVSGK